MDYRHVLQHGTVLDRKYRIERVIGSGGFGITYEAFDLGLATPVAIKEYYPAQFGLRDATLSVRARSEGDRPIFERLLASFIREARTLARFDHPAIPEGDLRLPCAVAAPSGEQKKNIPRKIGHLRAIRQMAVG